MNTEAKKNSLNKAALKQWCESSLINFVKYIFKEVNGRPFQVKPFHIKICNALERAHKGEIRRLIINIPPRTGKTELEIMFMAWELALNPRSYHLHLSYSDALSIKNSAKVKEYVQSKAFQTLWPMTLKADTKAKGFWENTSNGGVYAAPIGGQITGMGAGVRGEGAGCGAILIDDPIKPSDSNSDTTRNKCNDFYMETIQNRVNNPEVPHIVIMQRLHEEDLSGFLLDGGNGQEWEHVKIPVLTEDGTSIWPEELRIEDLDAMKSSNPYYFAGQYMQDPAPAEGGTWKKSWFEIIDEKDIPEDVVWELIVDPAYTAKTQNDPTGLMIGGWSEKENKAYIYEVMDEWLEMPDLVNLISDVMAQTPLQIECILIEPKANGLSLIQLINRETQYPAIESPTPTKSKVERARIASPHIQAGKVKLIKGSWNDDYLYQISMFPNGKHDEHVDNTGTLIERSFHQQEWWCV